MRAGRASRTAEQNALFRALEASRPAARRVCDDHLARHFLGRSLAFAALLGALPGVGALVPRFIDWRWPGVRSSVVARTRLIDDAIAGAMREGVEQVAILGAGFDSRAYRLPSLRGVPVFEVDHPDTQAAKRRALERALPAVPEPVRFVEVDFDKSDLATAMPAGGFRESARTLFLWEGVTNYLTEPGVDATLRWCARAAPGSLLLFTYVHRDILTKPESFVGTRNLFAALDRAGERFTFGIEPSALSGYLAERGLTLVFDMGAADYRARYYGDDVARRMRGHEFYRVAQARVRVRTEAARS